MKTGGHREIVLEWRQLQDYSILVLLWVRVSGRSGEHRHE